MSIDREGDRFRPKPALSRRMLSLALRGLLPIVVVVVGALGAARLIQTAPQARQRAPQRTATLVETRAIQAGTHPVGIKAMGTVIAAEEVVLQPQVSGIIQELHEAFVPGGRMDAGEVAVRIDPADYEVAVEQANAALARADAQLHSAVRELERMVGLEAQRATNRKELDDAQTAKDIAEADVAAARAALQKSKLDLARTTIRAPFDCIVQAENVDVGAQVTPQTPLATLVGTKEYWVRATVPVDDLRWITLPHDREDSGSLVHIHQRLGTGVSATWSGRVVRLLGDLEPQGRMARLLVSVPQPLGNSSARAERLPLLIGSYVEVEIEGRELSGVFALGRDELREGDTVWIMTPEETLEPRPVDVVFRGRDYVLVRSGLTAVDRLIMSDLSSPVGGMPLRTNGRSSDSEDTNVARAEETAPQRGAP